LHHVSESVRVAQIFEGNVTRLVSGVIELLVDLGLKTLDHAFSWLGLQFADL
jgi:hypothetical protein